LTVAQCRQIEAEIVKNEEQRAAFLVVREAGLGGGDAMDWGRTEKRKTRRKKKNAKCAADKSGAGVFNVPQLTPSPCLRTIPSTIA
jgi:hypothetical protein